MITIEINDKFKLECKEGETILSALERVNVKVPTLCHLKDLFPTGACRLCSVEIEGMNGLVPACAYPVANGMKIKTHSPRALKARKTIIELLLASHPDDCLYCERNKSCELQDLASELGVWQRRYSGEHANHHLDNSSPAIVRDPAKCILCGKCVRVCEEIQGVGAIDFINRGSKSMVGPAFNEGMNISSCVNCGQCIMVCPTGALRENISIREVFDALNDPQKMVVVQHAPSISVTLGEEFGIKPGNDVIGVMNTTLRRLGFDRVFDTGFTADLTIMEEAAELVARITKGGQLPMMTSCSPGWIKFVEQFYPEMIANLSTCKSPQQMMGAIIKNLFAVKEGIEPKNIYSVAIMPCIAKKFEADRNEMIDKGIPDVDAVLTTRELAKLIRMRGLDLSNMEPSGPDTPFGERSSAGKLFGVTGGVMEAAIRTAHFMITGKDADDLKIQEVRGLEGRKEVQITINEQRFGFAVVSGLGNARKLLEEIKAGKDDVHFIEVMTCPGGCIAGGGQPLTTDKNVIKTRMKTLYEIDRDSDIRTSHQNPHIKRIYDEFLGEPLGEKSHHLLHTSYHQRIVLM